MIRRCFRMGVFAILLFGAICFNSHASEIIAYDFIQNAPQAYWHNNDGTVAWGTDNASGSCRQTLKNLENKTEADVLYTHPKWIENGFMHAAYANVSVPSLSEHPRLTATFGFVEGADNSSGARFHFSTYYQGQWYSIVSVTKQYDKKLKTIDVDMNAWAGKNITIYLSVDAGENANSDWAVWKKAVITARNPIEGYVDDLNTNNHILTGWVRDIDMPNQSLEVKIFFDGVFYDSVYANEYRADLGGYYGFEVVIPSNRRSGVYELKTVAISYNGTIETELVHSPLTVNYNTGVVLGSILKVYEDHQMPFTADATLATIKLNNGLMNFYHTVADETYKFEGWPGPGNLFSTPPEWVKTQDELHDLNGHFSQYKCARLWIESIYQAAPNVWLSFSHIEKFPLECGRYDNTEQYSIGMSISYDQGDNWKFLGEIIKPCPNDAGNVNNIGGTPVLIVGEYFYVYFNEHSQSCFSVARATVNNVIDAAYNNTTTAWSKYSGGGEWNADALTGVGASVGDIGDAHTDAAYNAHSGKYYYLHASLGFLKLEQSIDGINWTDLVSIDPDSSEGGYVGRTFYATFISPHGTSSVDNMTIDRNFYVLWPRKHPIEYTYDEYMLRKVITN